MSCKTQNKWEDFCKILTHPNLTQYHTGAFYFLSKPLAQHAYLDGTTLEHKRVHLYEGHELGEDLVQGNLIYSDPNISVKTLKLISLFDQLIYRPYSIIRLIK